MIKRQIKIFITIIIVCITCIMCVKMYNKEEKKINETLATPVTNKTIVLDAGHGLPDEGATGFSGTVEQKINLEIVLKLQKILEQSGCKVILTRIDENGIYEANNNSIRTKKISDMKNRVYIGNNSEAEMYVSIHLNYYTESKYNGWQTFYQRNSEKSKRLAELIQKEMTGNINRNNRLPKVITESYILNKVNIPSVIVECGFLSNPTEEQNLKKSSYQFRLVWGIYLGLQKYFEEDK